MEDLNYLPPYLWCLEPKENLIHFVEWINSLSRKHLLNKNDIVFCLQSLLSTISHILTILFLLEMPDALKYERTHLKNQTILR